MRNASRSSCVDRSTPIQTRHVLTGNEESGPTTHRGRSVREEGVEPSRPYGHMPLKHTRLPVTPLPRDRSILLEEHRSRRLHTIATMRRTADVVIVGGGIIGASIAYHLTKKGVRDILVLERDRLGSGSTGKNAGGIRLQFSSEINVKLSQTSLPHIERFADEIGTDPHFHQVGYLFLITEDRDVAAFERSLAMWSRLGVPARRVTASEAKALFKHARTDDFPLTIEFASGLYAHRESGGVLLGMADPDEKPGFDDSVNPDFMPAVVERALGRFPILERTSIKTGWAGLYEDTPDKHPILGKVDGVEGFICAAGFSGHGVMHAPATGELLAELIVDGRTSLDINALRASRFGAGEFVREHNVI